jgi:PadR family transcriptional regulator PadR
VKLGKESLMDDIEESVKKFQKEMAAGTSSLVLLSVLARAREPMYGYQIAKLIEAGFHETGIIKQGALYPVLRSMESAGLLHSEVEPSVSGPPRRYYRITDAGRATLGRWEEVWDQTRQFVETILKRGEGNG